MEYLDAPEPPDQVTLRVPIGGLFPSLFHFAPGMGPEFERILEAGCVWRRPTGADVDLIERWFDYFREFHSDDAIQRGTNERTVLAADEPLIEDEEHMRDWGLAITSLILSTTLCTEHISLRYQTLRFRFDAGQQTPKSGTNRFDTLHLASWGGPAAEELTPTLADSIVGLYPYVRRALGQSIEHRVARALVAYRIATSSTHFSDHLPVLLCAALEALTAETREAEVIKLLQPYGRSIDAPNMLARLYRNRQWFAHGIDIPEMRDAQDRAQSLEDGLSAVKEIIRNALVDDDLFDVAFGHARDVRRHLEQLGQQA